VDVALTQHNVWAVDSIGNIFFHFGPPLQSPALLNNQQPSSTSSWQAVGSLSDQNTGAMSWAGNALKQTGSALKRGGLQATHIVRLYAGYSADSMVSRRGVGTMDVCHLSLRKKLGKSDVQKS